MPKTILIAPLDWGLGHASRCIPIIHYLAQQASYKIILAGSGPSLDLLIHIFPDLPVVYLPAYQIHYRHSSMWWSIGRQLPKIMITVFRENYLLRQLLKQQQIEMVISDCRFGLFSKKCFCIFISHQVNIILPKSRIPFFQSLSSTVVNYCNHWLIRQFNEHWIPDFENQSKSLSGQLSHPGLSGISKYIGPLSSAIRSNRPIRYDLTLLLSGPEPQRTYLEQKLLTALSSSQYTVLLIQGKVGESPTQAIHGNIEIYSYLAGAALQEAINASRLLIVRSGYSTIMDLFFWKKPALLIPTPGQSEQHYLAQWLSDRHSFSYVEQDNLSLQDINRCLLSSKGFGKQQAKPYEMEHLQKTLDALL